MMPEAYDERNAGLLAMSIEDLQMSVRTSNVLMHAGIHTVAELVCMTSEDLLAIRNSAQKCVDEIQAKLVTLGLALLDECDEEQRMFVFAAAFPGQADDSCRWLRHTEEGLRGAMERFATEGADADLLWAVSRGTDDACEHIRKAVALLEPYAKEAPQALAGPEREDGAAWDGLGKEGRGGFSACGAGTDDGNESGFPFDDGVIIGSTKGLLRDDDFDVDAIDPTELLIDYNEAFAHAGKTLFRDELIAQMLGVLIGKAKPNVLLVGSAGTGKTRIVEDIAYRLASHDPLVPPALDGFTIWELPLSNVVAGSGIVGKLEEKVKAVIGCPKAVL